MSDQKEKFLLLDKILQNGIEKLLEHMKKHNYHEPPFGRLPDPTPLITEDEFLSDGGLNSSDDDPEFKFEYGFDPLKFLSDYLIWAHPETIEARRMAKVDALKRLRFRANHAKLQLLVQLYMNNHHR